MRLRQAGTRPGAAVRDCRRPRPPTIACGGDQTPLHLVHCGTRSAAVSQPSDVDRGLQEHPSELPTGRLQRPRPSERAWRAFGHVSEHATPACGCLSYTNVSPGARVASLATSGWHRGVMPGSTNGFGPRSTGAASRACPRVASRCGAEAGGAHSIRFALQSGADHRGSSDPRRLAGPRRWRHRLVPAGRGRALWRSRVSRLAARVRPRGGPRAPGLVQRRAASRWQHRGEGVRALDEGFLRGLVSTASAGFGSCRPPPGWSLLRRGGTGTQRQRGSVTATKRGSAELVESAATSTRSVRRIG